MKLTMKGILKAEESPFLNPSRNGTTRARERRRRPLRLPVDLWEQVDQIKEELSSAFPGHPISRNSALEFLIRQGLTSIATDLPSQ